ncbi:MAG TPA: threonine synthase [bacterium]|nr:threonine synthase [bacterium]
MGVVGLACRECGRRYPVEPIFVCEQCFGPLEAQYDEGHLSGSALRDDIERGPTSIWRYQALLPATRVPEWDLAPGFTPLVRAERLGRAIGLNHLYIKNDTRNPTWSFKDRVVAVAVSAAQRFGFDVLSCASTGNLANAVAAHAAKAGMRAVVFIPKGIERAKVVATSVYHPLVVEVEGTYDDVNRLCLEIGEEHHWAIANVNLRPYYSEGAKTLAYEVAEQLGWEAPDRVIVPIGSGNMFMKIYKGFEEFRRLGVIPDRTVRMTAAQAEGCGPVATSYRSGATEVIPVRPNTIAHSLAIGSPADGGYVLETIRRTGGAAEAVTDAELVDAIRLLAETEGLFTEPAGGVTIGALRKLAQTGVIGPDEVTVAYITGIGLKAIEAVEHVVTASVTIKPTLASFEQHVLASAGALGGE